jgi:hypothetical protein
MKKLLAIFFLAFAVSACQSNNKKEPTNIQAGQKPTHNPAHGQPFHDCALPVGAPLTANAGEIQQAAPTIAEPVAEPKIEIKQQAAPVNNNVKLNPAHGEPGHKCELPVGAPLS